ncbi:hypothetical protein C5614_04005 [Massilia phosphatilytica]|nr:hypothetical protein C5614_04005 [Massilia phosphatilytica]
MKNGLISGLLACALAWPVAAVGATGGDEISQTGQPHSWDVQGAPFENPGFHGARWGMTMDEVKAVVAASWPDALATARLQFDDAARTTALAITVPVLAPGPGPAQISYVFGAGSKRLVAVHQTWTIPGNPGDVQRAALLRNATALAGELAGYQWPGFATTRGRVTAPGELILFAGRDFHGGGVEIRVGGVPLDVELPGAVRKVEHRAAPEGPAHLRKSLVASIEHPDIYSIPPGAF